MLPAFQTYCLQQSTSVNMLNTLEKEKELLRYTQHEEVELPLDSRDGKVSLFLVPATFLMERTAPYQLCRAGSILRRGQKWFMFFKGVSARPQSDGFLSTTL